MARLSNIRWHEGSSIDDARMELESREDAGRNYTVRMELILTDAQGREFRQWWSTPWEGDLESLAAEAQSYADGIVGREHEKYRGLVIGVTSFSVGVSDT